MRPEEIRKIYVQATPRGTREVSMMPCDTMREAQRLARRMANNRQWDFIMIGFEGGGICYWNPEDGWTLNEHWGFLSPTHKRQFGPLR